MLLSLRRRFHNSLGFIEVVAILCHKQIQLWTQHSAWRSQCGAFNIYCSTQCGVWRPQYMWSVDSTLWRNCGHYNMQCGVWRGRRRGQLACRGTTTASHALRFQMVCWIFFLSSYMVIGWFDSWTRLVWLSGDIPSITIQTTIRGLVLRCRVPFLLVLVSQF